jgi:serine/threonine-protein kinase
VFLDTPANEFQPTFSPDGKWLAYTSNESGQLEVYVRPFPGPGGKWQISTGGGRDPVWSRTRPELFYVRDQRIMVATYAADRDSLRADRPRQVSETLLSDLRPGSTLRMLDLHPDGQRFALATRPETFAVKQDKVIFIFNFFDELRRIAPTTRK